jgi:hypothetical protein
VTFFYNPIANPPITSRLIPQTGGERDHTGRPNQHMQTLIRMSDLIFIMKHKTLLMYHHELDLAAQQYNETLNMNAFVSKCMDVCQGSLDLNGIIEEAYGYAYCVVADGMKVPSFVSHT